VGKAVARCHQSKGEMQRVHSMDRLKLLGSVILPSGRHSHGLAAAGAMSICVAIVLNAGPFAKPPNAGLPVALAGQAVPSVMGKVNGSALMAPEEVTARDPQVFELAAQQTSVSEPISTPPQPSPPPVDITPALAPPAPAMQSDPDRQNAERAAIVGVWAPDAGTCSVRDFRDGVLPTVITNEGAWAGEAFCIFTKRTEMEKGWRAVAKCSTPRESWTAHIRLKINDNRLIWTSERGTQAYSRCGPDVLMAAR
jgi:hypothetical protein